MFNKNKEIIKGLELTLKNEKEQKSSYIKRIIDQDKEIDSLKMQLEEAKNLKFILNTLVSYNKNCITYSGSDGVCLTMDDSRINFKLTDDIPQYVEDIFDSSKKVIKQESNLGIIIDKDGKVTTGRTRFACDKNKNYKLKQI